MSLLKGSTVSSALPTYFYTHSLMAGMLADHKKTPLGSSASL